MDPARVSTVEETAEATAVEAEARGLAEGQRQLCRARRAVTRFLEPSAMAHALDRAEQHLLGLESDNPTLKRAAEWFLDNYYLIRRVARQNRPGAPARLPPAPPRARLGPLPGPASGLRPGAGAGGRARRRARPGRPRAVPRRLPGDLAAHHRRALGAADDVAGVGAARPAALPRRPPRDRGRRRPGRALRARARPGRRCGAGGAGPAPARGDRLVGVLRGHQLGRARPPPGPGPGLWAHGVRHL